MPDMPPPSLVFDELASSKSYQVMTVGLGLLAAPGLAALLARPQWLHALLREDEIYESLQAILFFLGGLVFTTALILALRRTRPRGFLHFFLALMAVGMVLVALEEISYGQRIFGFQTPGSLQSINVQDELNFHNIATGFFNRAFAAAAVLGGFFLPVLADLSTRLANVFKRLRVCPPTGPGLQPFAFAVLFTTPSKFQNWPLDEQRLLPYLVIAVLLVLVIVCLRRPSLRQWRRPMIVFAITVVTIKTLLLVLDGRWPGDSYTYAEEVKELFIAVGLLCYAWACLKAQLRPSGPSATQAA